MSSKDADTYYPKYITLRKVGKGPGQMPEIVDPYTTFTLVLDPERRDPHAVVALKAYADSCEADMPGLASALRKAFPDVAQQVSPAAAVVGLAAYPDK